MPGKHSATLPRGARVSTWLWLLRLYELVAWVVRTDPPYVTIGETPPRWTVVIGDNLLIAWGFILIRWSRRRSSAAAFNIYKNKMALIAHLASHATLARDAILCGLSVVSGRSVVSHLFNNTTPVQSYSPLETLILSFQAFKWLIHRQRLLRVNDQQRP